MAPVFSPHTILFVYAGKSEEFSAFTHFFVQTDMNTLDSAKSVTTRDHDAPQVNSHCPTSIPIPVKAGDSKQLMSLHNQFLC